MTTPFLYELTPDEARKVLDDLQAAPIDKPAIEDWWVTEGHKLPVILYMHGGGWILERVIRWRIDLERFGVQLREASP